jgi:OmcA/MtrC family decaheme c-type cytochrome
MLTGGLGYSYNNTSTLPLTQTNVAGYPTAAVSAALVTQNGLNPKMSNRTGGLIVVAPDKQLVASAGAVVGGTGGAYTGRRTIVDDALCNKCHQELGPFTEDAFHAGQRNDGTTCAWCHTPNRTSSGWSVDSTSFIHAIHAAAKRNPTDTTQPQAPFTYDATSTTDGFFKIGYPGILKTCTTCHTPDGFDFSSTAATAALPNRLYRTVATGIFNGTVGTVTAGCTPSATSDCKATALSVFRLSPDVLANNVKDYGAGYNTNTAVAGVGVANNLVNSPIATACFACHATTVAKQHMQSNGGSIYDVRGTPAAGGVAATGALAKAEQCMFCHSSTSAFGLGIKAVHAGN